MTDYTKLIERLDTELLWTLNYEAQDAIKALQSECAEHKENAMRNARQAVVFRAERDALQSAIEALQAENERLKVESTNKNDWLVEQRKWEAHANALQAKLDAMGKGEPVSGNVEILMEAAEVLDKVRSQCDDAWERFGLRDYLPDELHGTALIVRDAAPKALAPLTQTEVVEAFCNTRHNTQYVSVFDAGVRFAEKHHGIGGTQ